MLIINTESCEDRKLTPAVVFRSEDQCRFVEELLSVLYGGRIETSFLQRFSRALKGTRDISIDSVLLDILI